MLVLTRRKDESIMIGDNIEIVVVEIKDSAVRIGIKAPKNIPVYRSEVYWAIKAENLAATETFEVDLLGEFEDNSISLVGDDESK